MAKTNDIEASYGSLDLYLNILFLTVIQTVIGRSQSTDDDQQIFKNLKFSKAQVKSQKIKFLGSFWKRAEAKKTFFGSVFAKFKLFRRFLPLFPKNQTEQLF